MLCRLFFPCGKEKSVAYSLLPLQGQGYEVCMHHVQLKPQKSFLARAMEQQS